VTGPVSSFQPELWVEHAAAAVDYYAAAFGAAVLHRVGEDDDIVAQLAVGEAVFWVTSASPGTGRFSPLAIGGATGRVLLVVQDPATIQRRAVEAGARETWAVQEEHGWLVGRIVDPFGHEWEIGRPAGVWPPAGAGQGPSDIDDFGAHAG
jgi:PhnB protein